MDCSFLKVDFTVIKNFRKKKLKSCLVSSPANLIYHRDQNNAPQYYINASC